MVDPGVEAELTTERLLLRAPRRADLEELDQAIRETLPELVRWLPWACCEHGRGDTRRFIRGARIARNRRVALEYVMVERSHDKLVGTVGIHRIDWSRRSAGLGYWVRRSEWGRGYATEAARAVVEDSVRRFGLHRIEAHVATENLASQRIPLKLGFQREGIAREVEFVNGRYLDHIQYSLLGSEVLGALEDSA